MRADWEELPDHFDGDTSTWCSAYSLHHAVGARGRAAALESMSRLLRRGGAGTHLPHRELEGQRFPARSVIDSSAGTVAMPPSSTAGRLCHWEHHIEIAIAQVDAAGLVLVRSELLSCCPQTSLRSPVQQAHSLSSSVLEVRNDMVMVQHPMGDQSLTLASSDMSASCRPYRFWRAGAVRRHITLINRGLFDVRGAFHGGDTLT